MKISINFCKILLKYYVSRVMEVKQGIEMSEDRNIKKIVMFWWNFSIWRLIGKMWNKSLFATFFSLIFQWNLEEKSSIFWHKSRHPWCTNPTVVSSNAVKQVINAQVGHGQSSIMPWFSIEEGTRTPNKRFNMNLAHHLDKLTPW